MTTGLTKANTVEIVQGIDLVGMTLCSMKQNGIPPEFVQESMIIMLGQIRARLCESYGLRIDPLDSLTGNPVRDHCSPADVAEEILRDLDTP
jgi:hypothetical protein